MNGGEREREREESCDLNLLFCFQPEPPPPPPPLSLWQGFPVEFLCGPSSFSINLDVSRAGHNRPTLNTVPGDVSQDS